MSSDLQALTRLALGVQGQHDLDGLLGTVIESVATLVNAEHVSVRVLDGSGQRLVAHRGNSGPDSTTDTGAFALDEGLLGWVATHRAPLRTNDAAKDPRFAPRQDAPISGAFVGVPLVSSGTNLGVLSALHRHRAFDERDEQLLILVAAICAPHLEIARLYRLSEHDPLTGTLNRRGLHVANETHADLVSYVMADIDHFKTINDTYGHAAGDTVLQQLSNVLKGVLRASDSIARYGGEEFVLILRDVDPARARAIAERARVAVEAHPFEVGDTAIDVTVSMGIAARRDAESSEDTIARADAAMYRAKRGGRNRVETDEHDEPNSTSDDASC